MQPVGIVGNGKVARHMQNFFFLKEIPCISWSRSNKTNPKIILKNSNIIFLAITDSSIHNFIEENNWIIKKFLIHFSGSLSCKYAHGIHPLMTFSDDLYEPSIYEKIPFIHEEEGPSFKEIFPSLNNPCFKISIEKKAWYHAQCVMASNFTVLLWNNFFKKMKEDINIDQLHTIPFLEQTFNNIFKNSKNALTGPFQRKDTVTIKNNYQALSSDSFQEIYSAFIKVFSPDTYNDITKAKK
jgi:predicted short-subunit dehydrogenase-like oxidoreductase (DUF2520 family)